MSYSDAVYVAAQHALDWDMPTSLWGNTIVSEASMLAGLDSDLMGCAAWD
jgi:hypothetical protein